jgi:hypothetical protein
MSGGNNYWPAAYSPRTKLIYIPSLSSCNEVTLDPSLSSKAGDWKGATFRNIERNESDMIVADPLTGEIKRKVHIPYPNNSGALTTAGGVVFTGYTDGTFVAYDDTTMEQLWKINVGIGFNAPPMTFEVNGKQYVAVLSGLSPITRRRHQFTPELREQRNQTMLFVLRCNGCSANACPLLREGRRGWVRLQIPRPPLTPRPLPQGEGRSNDRRSPIAAKPRTTSGENTVTIVPFHPHRLPPPSDLRLQPMSRRSAWLIRTEPQNWLMNHRSYDSRRFSPLARIGKDSIKASARLRGHDQRHLGERNLQATPLVGTAHVSRRHLGHITDRCALGHGRPHRLAHGSQTGACAGARALQSRCRALGQFRHLGRELSAAHRGHQQRHR